MINKKILLLSMPLLLVACEENQNIVQPTKNIAPLQLPKITIDSVSSEHAKQVAEALQASKARLASRTSNICPKLVEFNLKSQSITRSNEELQKWGCLYFIYPDVDNNIKLSLDNSALEARIIHPDFFDFKNGNYKVASNQKHIIEVKYKKHHGDREPQKYEITIAQVKQ